MQSFAWEWKICIWKKLKQNIIVLKKVIYVWVFSIFIFSRFLSSFSSPFLYLFSHAFQNGLKWKQIRNREIPGEDKNKKVGYL